MDQHAPEALRQTERPLPDQGACGVGIVARRDGQPCHSVLEDALRALANLEHRGGCAADGKSGDGSGVLTDIPFELLGLEAGKVAVATLFVRDEADIRYRAFEIFRTSFGFFGLDVLHVRDVPTDANALGEEARASMPRILHVVLRRPAHCSSRSSFAALLYRAKQEVRRRHKEAGLHRAFFFASLSAKTIVYKALTRADDLARFYPDLRDARFRTRFALFHRRFSTNTRTTWDKAQPFRVLCHNGEINTIRGNRTWARSREIDLGLPAEDLLTRSEISDSGSFNEMAEALRHRSSMPRTEDVLALLMPPCDTESGYYRFWSRALEPWDGPALIAYADGESVGARLDRNGFRPCRWAESDDCFYLASEAGAFGRPDGELRRKGLLSGGEAVRLDLQTGELLFRDPSNSRENEHARFDPRLLELEPSPTTEPVDAREQHLFGVTAEEIKKVLDPTCEHGKDPIGSMGDTARIAVLSDEPRPLFDFFYQHFAQVTNPPLDYLRERLVTDLSVYLGRRPNIFAPREMLPPPPAFLLPSPVLSLGALATIRRRCGEGGDLHRTMRQQTLDLSFARADGPAGLEQRMQQLGEQALAAHEQRTAILILSDRTASRERPPVPSLLALRAVVRALNRAGRRLDTALVVDCGDARSVHAVSALVGFGATAVCPRVALRHAAARDREDRLVHAFEEGLLKTMSKVGISVARSYQSSKLFCALGLGPRLIADWFPDLDSPIGGLEIDDLARRLLRHTDAAGEGPRPAMHVWREQAKGLTGERHLMTTARSRLLHSNKPADERYRDFADHARNEVLALRDLLEVQPARNAIAEHEVQSTADILTRFVAGGMSFGALSAESQRDIFHAMQRIGGRSCSGEGGDNPFYFVDGTEASIKQVASGRFGVTAEYLAGAREYEIKIAQGAKPGEGGQLMGRKVNDDIARARHATPGRSLISPPPLHDIYSIEDLAGLIHELKQFQPAARVGVKLVANSGLAAIAVGVAKAGADTIAISGGDGGTGAAPLTSMKHAGLPWETGLAEAHLALVENGLRDRVELRVDGSLSTGRDLVLATAFGADSFAFGKLLLIAEGCIMARVCENNTCPAGIATQDPKFRARYRGSSDAIVGLLQSLAGDLRERLARLGLKSLSELRGRVDLVHVAEQHRALASRLRLDFGRLLRSAAAPPPPPAAAHATAPALANPCNERILQAAQPALTGKRVTIDVAVRSTDRAVPARLSLELAQRTRALRRQPPHSEPADLPDGTITLRCTGSAGQGFGVFLCCGVELQLIGEANDSVGKSMSGGVIAIHPASGVRYEPADNAILGNAALYGATGGCLYANGRAGDRFAVRNSGALAVVEGTGMHACEYMTAGTVAILGDVGRNVGAGMTGGDLFLPRSQLAQVNGDYLAESGLDKDAGETLLRMLRDHERRTGSHRARQLLCEPQSLTTEFVLLRPVGTIRASPRAAPGRQSTPPTTAVAHDADPTATALRLDGR